jgi:hypothetical protein
VSTDAAAPGRLPALPFPALIVRTTAEPVAMARVVQRLARETKGRATLDGVGSLSGRLSASVSRPRAPHGS